ncbi:MAG: hypothetical protein Q9201_000022 [Fulgogasparrea decipioides]
MSPKQRIRLQVRDPASAPDDIILQANALLSAGRGRQAIDLYTDVLYNKAPGHIIAFLNRSLAYLLERRPELAATDAYRAAICVNEMGDSTHKKARQRALDVRRYLRAEKIHFDFRQEWTRPAKRNIPGPPGTWTKRPLASILIDEDNCPVSVNYRGEILCMRLQARAVYRLAGALSSCKGGAAQDALGLISDVLFGCKMTLPERQCFFLLGDSITRMVTDTVDIFRQAARETDDEHSMLMRIGETMVRKTKPDIVMKTRVCLAPAVVYWKDTYEPDFSKFSTYQELQSLTSTCTETCTPAVVDQSSLNLMPSIQMRAAKDHLPGDTLIYERSPWHVTTNDPATTLKERKFTKARCLRLYCDTCATALLMPEELVGTLLVNSGPQKAPAEKSSPTPCGDQQTDSEKKRRRLKWCMKTQISFCDTQHQAVYCSKTCRRKRRHFDPGLHDTKIERDLRQEKFPTNDPPLQNMAPAHPRGFYCHSKVQTLRELLFLRIYSSALNADVHPLELVKFLRGNLSPGNAPIILPPTDEQPPPPSETRPAPVASWSFTNNIVTPIWCINRYHAGVKQDPFQHLRQSDGWVINTLIAKIQASVEISRGAMSAIIYNMEEESKTYCYRGLEPWVDNVWDAVYESEKSFDDVWVGLLDPVASIIRIADETKGEKPNCWLKYEEGVRVIAGQPDDPPDKQDVAVRQGELLLRPKPAFLGGSPYEVQEYTQRESTMNIIDRGDHPMTDSQDQCADSTPSIRRTVVYTSDNDDDINRTSSAEIEDMLKDMPDDISTEDPDSIVSSLSPELPAMRGDASPTEEPTQGLPTKTPMEAEVAGNETPDLSRQMQSMMDKGMLDDDCEWEDMDVDVEMKENAEKRDGGE